MSGTDTVMAAYPPHLRPHRIESLGSAGGFSGAQFWRLQAAHGTLCLRKWPQEHPSPSRLEYIHTVLRHATDRGVGVLPTPLPTSCGASFTTQSGYLWELTPWLPGQADFRTAPSSERLVDAMHTLARFHAAVATFDAHILPATPSPGISERLERVNWFQQRGQHRISRVLNTVPDAELLSRARRILDLFPLLADRVRLELTAVAQRPVPLQPCIRDVRHDHVLYTGSRVTGIVDFGAMRRETVAADVARLLGSLAGDDSNWRQLGLEAYQSVHALSDIQLRLFRVFDFSTVLLSGMNWLQWIYADGRSFEHRESVLERLDETIVRLERRREELA
jgi:homoserine kinase type II